MDEYTRPSPDRAALLTIDVQNDFALPDAPAEVEGTAEVVPRIGRLVEAFRAADAPIVHVVRLYEDDGSNVDLCRRRAIEDGEAIVRPGTDGAELVAELRPTDAPRLDADRLLAGELQALGPTEWALYKPRWSAFYDTDLLAFLEDRDIDTVVVCGCNFPNCPRSTVYDASERDLRVLLVEDATSKTYERGLAEFEAIGVAVRDVATTVEWLRA